MSNRLGKYRLLGELGRGGMAHVYLALAMGPSGFNKLVVIKQIQRELADEPEFVTMFLDEARLAARLNHPNVVQTNEVGHDGDRYFIAMEYLEGQTLRHVLTKLGRGPDARFSVNMQLRVMIDALAGLHYAHELTDYDGTPLGVVHRDVSPHNIFVTYSGQVKMVDFGIAKALNSVGETRTGVLKGKVAYMSPEHARNEPVDRRADIYAAGIVLWEVATGQRLFRTLPEVAVLQKLLYDEIPRPSEHRPDVDHRLEAIVMKAMAHRPDDRYPTAAALAADIEALLREQGDESTCRDVGKLVAERFATDRARISTLVEAQIREHDAGPVSRDLSVLPRIDLEVAGVTGSGPRALDDAQQSTEITASATLVLSRSPSRRAPSPRSRWLWIAPGAIVALVLTGYFVLRSEGAAETIEPLAAPPGVPSEPPVVVAPAARPSEPTPSASAAESAEPKTSPRAPKRPGDPPAPQPPPPKRDDIRLKR